MNPMQGSSMLPTVKSMLTPPAGRPKVNIKPFILKPTDRLPAGAEYLNAMPSVLKAVHQNYLSKFKLPPALAPSYIRRPEIMEQRRAKAISKGWNKPRSHF